jgi:hypothetical protein
MIHLTTECCFQTWLPLQILCAWLRLQTRVPDKVAERWKDIVQCLSTINICEKTTYIVSQKLKRCGSASWNKYKFAGCRALHHFLAVTHTEGTYSLLRRDIYSNFVCVFQIIHFWDVIFIVILFVCFRSRDRDSKTIRKQDPSAV